MPDIDVDPATLAAVAAKLADVTADAQARILNAAAGGE